MKVAIFGTFDVDNFGDLLFPLVAEWRMPSIEWVAVSPSVRRTVFSDAKNAYCIEELSSHILDGVLVGGGNIVHIQASRLETYRRVARTAYPSTWLGAAVIATRRKIPLVFNAPSIASPTFGVIGSFLLKKVLQNAAYVAFRDMPSTELANRLVSGRGACLVPDTVFDISRMWPIGLFKNGSSSSEYFIVHVNRRYGGSPESVAEAIDSIARRENAIARILPIGLCHGDFQYAKDVSGLMETKAEIVTDFSLLNFAKQIALAKLYCGSSMHGFITALSYGVPCTLVLNHSPMSKFSGVLGFANLSSEVVCATWGEAVGKTQSRILLSESSRERIYEKLDEHWLRIADVLEHDQHGLLPFWCVYWSRLCKLAQIEIRFVRRIRKFLVSH